MAASWLRVFLAPTEWFVNSVAQAFGNIVNFRSGFTSEITTNTDGVNVLNIDVSVADAVYNADPDTIVLRNGSGAIKATTVTGTAFTYSTPVEITRDEPVGVIMTLDPITGWEINSSLEPETNATGLEWSTEIKPPAGSSLKSVAVVYTPAGAHVGLPADQPSIALGTIDEDGTLTAVDVAQDNAADLLEYETTRTLTLTLGSPITVSATTRYFLLFVSEDSTNALPGLKLHRPARWTVDVGSL